MTLQSDISMPLAISALQKQVKKYLEACSGVAVQEVRVFVDGTTPATEETVNSPYAIPASLLGMEQDALPESTAHAEEPVQMPAQESACDEQPQSDEPLPGDEPVVETENAEDEKDQGDWA